MPIARGRRRFTVIVGALAVSASSLTAASAAVSQLPARPARSRPVVTVQPSNATVNVGQTATFTAAASGSPTPTVRWQVQAPGSSGFSNISGATSPTLSISGVTVGMSGGQYRAVFTNRAGSATTNAATLTVNASNAPVVITQPANALVSPGATATFTAAASGSPAPTVQWQSQPAGTTGFADIAGATSSTLTVSNVTTGMSGSQYHAVFTNTSGTATTNPATLTVTGPLDHLVLSPASASIGPGRSQAYKAEGFDSAGHDLGDVTGSTTLGISPDGSCTGASCTASANGTHTVTGHDGSATGTASLLVGATRFVELIFSRSEVTAADGTPCLPNDTNIARLDTVVEPYLQSLGLAATGSIETGPTLDNANWCPHNGQSEAASWAQLQALQAAGWTFVTHSSTYPNNASLWSAMTPSQMWDETCGAAQVIDAHGLHGASDMYLWPNNTGNVPNINSYAQSHFVEPCFGTARFYGGGLSTLTQLATPTYEQSVVGLHGGSCNVSGTPCSNVPGAPKRYLTPANVIAQLQALQPGQVFTLQSYVLVTGTNPTYATNKDRWDCTSSDPNLHWANDSERYCYSDWQAVVSYLASSGLGITQPGVVAAAAGRSGYSDTAVTRP